jgi:hypothetical protein
MSIFFNIRHSATSPNTEYSKIRHEIEDSFKKGNACKVETSELYNSTKKVTKFS